MTETEDSCRGDSCVWGSSSEEKSVNTEDTEVGAQRAQTKRHWVAR